MGICSNSRNKKNNNLENKEVNPPNKDLKNNEKEEKSNINLNNDNSNNSNNLLKNKSPFNKDNKITNNLNSSSESEESIDNKELDKSNEYLRNIFNYGKDNFSISNEITNPNSTNDSDIYQTIKYYKNVGMNHTILKINIDEEPQTYKIFNEFIFICDCSGSMCSYLNIIIKEVMPKVFEKLKYKNEQFIHLITFNDETKYYKIKVKDFKTSSLTSWGGTWMSKVPEVLNKILSNISPENGINILTLSDGMIHDQVETKRNVENLYKSLNGKFQNINSQAIRFLSDNNVEPDIRALCSFLQFGNINFFKEGDPLITYDPKDNFDSFKIDEFSDIISELFYQRLSGWRIVSNYRNLRVEPIGINYSSLNLPIGENTVFIDNLINKIEELPKIISIDGKIIKFDKGEDISLDNFEIIYENNIKKLINYIAIKKVIENQEIEKEIKEITKFIKELERNTNGLKNNNGKKIYEVFEEIKNDNKIKNLPNEELNNYLNEKIREYKGQVNEIINEGKKIRLNNFIQNAEFIILIDSSRYMAKSINNLIQNTIYNVCSELGFDEKYNLNIISFNSKNVIENYIQLKKLQNHKIICEGERELFIGLIKAVEIMVNNPKMNYFLLTIISGEIKDEKNLRILAFKLGRLSQKINIRSRIIKFINNKSDFTKNSKGKIIETKGELITYGLIRQLDTLGMISVMPLILNEDEYDGQKIMKIIELIK